MGAIIRRIILLMSFAGAVTPAGAQLHHFAIEAEGGGPIGDGLARMAFFVQIIAQDSLNQAFTSFNGTVEISSNGPLLSGGGTSAPFSAGILPSHSVNFGSGGVYNITATNSAGAESGASNSFTLSNPLPHIDALSPISRTAGDTGFTLTITGTGFTPVSSASFGGSGVATVFVSDSQLTASITAARIDTAGGFAVAVSSPVPGGGTSNQTVFTVLNPVLIARILLEGPHSGGGVMSTQLRTDGVIPLSQPYTGAPWNYTGTESVGTIPAGVVDWVLLGLRTGTSGASLASRRAAFLKSDGTVVDLDGSSPVAFSGVPLGDYFVVVRHRNHVAAMTATARPMNAPADSCDFTTGLGKYFGGSAKSLGGGRWAIFSGDYSGDGFIDASDFTGPDNEIFLSGYRRADLNLDGFIDASDFSFPDNNIFIGSNVPN